MLSCKLIIKKGISSKIWTNKYDMSSYLELAKIFAQEVEQILNMNSGQIHLFIFWNWSLFLLWVCIKAYDGCTIPSPNLEIESKYFRRTMILVYSAVLSAYVYTYVALHIRHCLKCRAEHRQSDRHGCPIDGHWWRCICPFDRAVSRNHPPTLSAPIIQRGHGWWCLLIGRWVSWPY